VNINGGNKNRVFSTDKLNPCELGLRPSHAFETLDSILLQNWERTEEQTRR